MHVQEELKDSACISYYQLPPSIQLGMGDSWNAVQYIASNFQLNCPRERLVYLMGLLPAQGHICADASAPWTPLWSRRDV